MLVELAWKSSLTVWAKRTRRKPTTKDGTDGGRDSRPVHNERARFSHVIFRSTESQTRKYAVKTKRDGGETLGNQTIRN